MGPKKVKNVLDDENKHFPVSKGEVDEWTERMSEVEAAIHDFLHEAPGDDVKRRQQREERKKQEALAVDKERRKRRYDTRFYSRYESDEVIDKLLAEADQDDDPKEAQKRKEREEAARRRRESEGYSKFEQLAMEEANKQKAIGNDAVKRSDWVAAKAAYDHAINLDPPDEALQVTLRNNRALVHVKLSSWQAAVEDATFVLARERHNVKALLRRARALVQLHRPTDALADVAHVLRADKNNIEAQQLHAEASQAEDEIAFADRVRAENPGEVDKLLHATRAIADGLPGLTAALKSEVVVTPGASEGDTVRRVTTRPDAEVDAAVEAFSLALCTVGTHLTDPGMATVFRMAGGLASLTAAFDVCEAACGWPSTDPTTVSEKRQAVEDAPHAGLMHKAGGIILTASMLRVIARALDAPTSVAIVCDTAETAQRMLFFAASTAANAAGGNMIAATAGMQLIAALSADARLAPMAWRVLVSPQAVALRTWIGTNWRDDPRSGEALRAVDNILKVEALQQAVVDFGWDALAMQAAGLGAVSRLHGAKASISYAIRDSGASLMCRLTAVPRWRATFDAKPEADKLLFIKTVTRVLASIVAASIENDLPRDALAVEALLAVAHNTSISAVNRVLVAAALDGEANLVPALMKLLSDGRRGTDQVPLNVIARILGLLAKVVLHSTVTVTAMSSQLTLLLSWMEPVPLATVMLQSERDYRDGCVENAALIVASVLSQAREAKPPHVDIAVKLCSMPLAEGFGRLVTVIRDAPARAAGNAAMALSSLPPLYPPAAILALQCSDFVKTFLERIVALRTHMFELERSNGRGNNDWIGCKGAKKNLAIALSKYCGNETIIGQVRDQRGIEILYTALDDSDKAQANPNALPSAGSA